MQITSPAQAAAHKNSEHCLVRAYPSVGAPMDGALATISGRYPERGFALNRLSHELAFVIKGSGAIHAKGESHPIAQGNLISISPNEAFAWEGDLELTDRQ